MEWYINLAFFSLAFIGMEFVAWAAHKYVMHGFLWFLHKDHHDEQYKILQKNDSFALIFAIPSWLCIQFGLIFSNYNVAAFGYGIAFYGFVYFLVHEVFIHQRLKYFRNSDNWYLRGIRRAHKVHHKHLGKEDGECFGMLIVPFKYFKEKNK